MATEAAPPFGAPFFLLPQNFPEKNRNIENRGGFVFPNLESRAEIACEAHGQAANLLMRFISPTWEQHQKRPDRINESCVWSRGIGAG
jgi:hypothetical protein